MIKRSTVRRRSTPPLDAAISLFDPENLELLDALRYTPPPIVIGPPATASGSETTANAAPSDSAERLFEAFRVDDHDESWVMGDLNLKIIHRGRMRIHRSEWPPIIQTCTAGFVQANIRKDFHLNVLQHAGGVRLIYISYRYKRGGEKQNECRRGILVDADTDIQNMMMNLSFWFTAQPHAENDIAVFDALVVQAMSKLGTKTA